MVYQSYKRNIGLNSTNVTYVINLEFKKENEVGPIPDQLRFLYRSYNEQLQISSINLRLFFIISQKV